MFHYDEQTKTWTNIGKIKKARRYHALLALDLSIVCPIDWLVNKGKKIREAPFFQKWFVYIYLQSTYNMGIAQIAFDHPPSYIYPNQRSWNFFPDGVMFQKTA